MIARFMIEAMFDAVTRRSGALHLALAVLFLFIAGIVDAATGAPFPARPIRFVSPFAPGGGNDTISRMLTQAMSRNIGQSIIVDNRPGANTIIGMELVAKAAPDGYTLIMTSSSVAINATLYKKLPYDSARDFAPVSLMALTPLVVVVHPSLTVTAIPELIALAKARPGQLFYPVSGVGNISHLAGELFSILAGVKLVAVPYKGAAPGMNDLLGGRLSAGFSSALSTLPHVKSGKLRALAVTSSSRSAGAPDLPTVAEAGLAGYEATTWYGVLAPAATPAPIVNWLQAEFVRALYTPEIKTALVEQGLDLAGNTPAQFASYIRAETAKWAKVINAAGIRLD